jgi:hypothetical protein
VLGDRLLKEGHCPSSQGSRLSYRRLFGADDDDCDGGQCGDSFQAIQDQETAASRKSEIQQDRIRSCVTGRRDCLKGIGRVDRLVAVRLQPQTQQEPRIRIIVDDQDGLVCHGINSLLIAAVWNGLSLPIICVERDRYQAFATVY